MREELRPLLRGLSEAQVRGLVAALPEPAVHAVLAGLVLDEWVATVAGVATVVRRTDLDEPDTGGRS